MNDPASVMGIVNVTPDSFSGDGLLDQCERVVELAERMVAEGAAILDVGGESTRPGHTPVSLDEELRRVIPAIRELSKRFSLPISVDTSKAEVARRALSEGAAIVNDVSGLRDTRMIEVAAGAGARLILVHHGVPKADDVMGDVVAALGRLVQNAEQRGVRAGNIVVDPGLGIGGKDWRSNFVIVRNLASLSILGKPVLVGASRKGMISRVLGSDVQDRLAGSLALATMCIAGGASIVRAHDVAETVDVAKMMAAILG
ncbi:MAG: dihydropteroate synthase [Chloroflexota bacterium]|nr:MAG: dihydropteroate synthase [Chloroflexota bacterium]